MDDCKTVCDPVDKKLDGVYSELKKKVSVWMLLVFVGIFSSLVGYMFTSRTPITDAIAAIQKSTAEINTSVQVQSKQYEYLGKELSRFGIDFEKRKDEVDREIRDIKRNHRPQ
jgi:hypothetical protein